MRLNVLLTADAISENKATGILINNMFLAIDSTNAVFPSQVC
jgi:hypothetical protein